MDTDRKQTVERPSVFLRVLPRGALWSEARAALLDEARNL